MILNILVLLALLPLAFIVIFFLADLKQSKKSNTKGLSLLQLLSNYSRRGEMLSNFLKQNQITGLYHFWVGPRFTVFAADPEAAQFVLKCPQIVKTAIPNRTIYVKEKLGHHVVTANGDDWRIHRTFLNPGFSQNSYKTYYPIFNQVIDKLFSKWQQLENQDIEHSAWLSYFTLDTLGQSVFHYDFGLLDGKLTTHYEAYEILFRGNNSALAQLYFIFPFLQNLPLPGAKKSRAAVDIIYNLFTKIIEEHKQNKHGDILDKLLEGEETHKLSQKELFSDIWALFVAGHETTSRALLWALAELADKPEIQDKLYATIQATWGNQEPDYESIHKPPGYLQAFLDENLRRHPPAPIIPTRTALADITYNNQVIPAGAQVGIDILSIHHHPEQWENPDVFDPERFMAENKKKGRHRYAFMPFSMGARQCIGNEFSEIEQRLFLVRLLQQFKVLPPKNHTPLNCNQRVYIHLPTSAYIRLEKRV